MTNHRPACPSQSAPQATFWHLGHGAIVPQAPSPVSTFLPFIYIHLTSPPPGRHRQTWPSVFAALCWAYLKESFASRLISIDAAVAPRLPNLPPAPCGLGGERSLCYYSEPIWASICRSLVPSSPVLSGSMQVGAFVQTSCNQRAQV